MELLHSFFRDRLISANLWPPWSSHSFHLDFFMWGYRKGRVYRTTPATLAELQKRIVEKINKINRQMLKCVFSNLIKRAQLRKDANGLQFQHLLWSFYLLHTLHSLTHFLYFILCKWVEFILKHPVLAKCCRKIMNTDSFLQTCICILHWYLLR